MNSDSPFTPGQGATYNATLSATAASASATLATGMGTIRIAVTGASPIAFRVTTGASTAVFASDTVMLAGSTELFGIPITADTISVISTGTATVYVSRGEGS